MARKRQNDVGQVSQILISGHAIRCLLLGQERTWPERKRMSLIGTKLAPAFAGDALNTAG
jgi:hypothetical protein